MTNRRKNPFSPFPFSLLLIHLFSDHLMATRFSLRIESQSDDAVRLRAVAEEVFEEMRRLESILSRFIEDSEISQINRLRAGESVVVSPETLRCLELAQEAARLTHGFFDAAYLSTPPRDAEYAWSIHSRPSRIRSETESLRIDPGGIGKGFALDYVSNLLRHHGVNIYLLGADTSTLLAASPPDHPGWPVVIHEKTVYLRNEAVSCSGDAVRGDHIYNTRKKSFTSVRSRVWITASTAAMADAFSTAALAMTPRELREWQTEMTEITVF